MDFYGTKNNGNICFSAMQLQFRKLYIESLKDGAEIKESITILRKSKTNKQVKAHWGMIINMSLAEFEDRGYDTSYILRLDKPTGIAISKDLLYEYLCNVCPIFDENGKRITLSKMDTAQASKFFEDCRNHLASQWSIYISEPDENWKDKK